MIRRLYSNDRHFKTLEFKPGMNILIAEKAATASDLQSRNGAGKTSMLRLIHFLMGAEADKDSIFLDPALREFSFGIDFDLGDEPTSVERSGSTRSRVHFRQPPARPPISLQHRKGEALFSLSNVEWRGVLGAAMFRLRLATDEQRAEKFVPTFRTLLPYFVRLNDEGGFGQPTKVHSVQQLWNQQVAIAFLLGLDWRIAQGMQQIRAQERTLKQLRQVLDDPENEIGLLPRSEDLTARLTVAVDRANQVKRDLSGYRINPQYHDLEAEANRLTKEIAESFDLDGWDRDSVASLEQSLSAEAPPDPVDLQRLYEEAGVVLPGAIKERFDEVRTFHESVLRNRQSYLRGELDSARARLTEREAKRRDHDARRAAIMKVLASTGALEQFTQMQSELGRLEGLAEHLKQQAEAAKQLEATRLELDIKERELELRLGRNHDEQRDRIEEAQLIFNEASRLLYEAPGALVVNRKLSGPPVKAIIQSDKSSGIQKMQIFCFDLTLCRLLTKQRRGPGFLVHDSHLFDGVDARQVAHALKIAGDWAVEHGFQYIATMNSDKAETVLKAGFDPYVHSLPVRLTDQEDGGLFGKRFA